MKTGLILLGFLILTSCTFSKENKKIHFKSFEIYKTKDKNKALTVKDIDNDGLKDIIMINNYDAVISIFYRLTNKEMKDYKKNFHKNITQDTINDLSFDFRYKKQPFITERNLKALTVDDLGKDKKMDIAYLTSTGELYIAYQTKKRTFTNKLLYRIPDFIPSLYSIYSEDLNGDKKKDLIVLGKNFLYVFYQKNELSVPVKFTYNAKSPLGVEISDLNGDGLKDILFVTSGGVNKLKVRFQQKDHSLGPEHSIDYPNFTYLVTKDILSKKGDELLSSRGNENIIFIDRLEKSRGEEFPKSVIYSLDPEAQNPSKSTLFDDFNKDGKIDMVVADSSTPFLMYFKGNKGIFHKYVKLPSFKGITKIKILKTSLGKEVLIYSKEEKSLALYNLNKKLPKIFSIEGDIEGVDIFKNKIYLLVKKDESYFFERYSITKRRELKKESSIKIETENEPADIMVVDFNYDKKADLLLFSTYDDSLFFQSKGDKLEKLKIDLKAISNFFKLISADKISFYDLDGDKLKEFVVSNKNIVRGLKFKDGKFKIIYQINGATNSSDLTNLVKANIKGKYFIAFDRMSHKLSLFNSDYTFYKNIDVPNLLVNKIVVKDLDKDGNKELILLGRKAVAVYNVKKAGYILKNYLTYKLPNPKSISTIVDFGNFGGKKIISIDGLKHFIEFFKFDNKKISFDMKFQVFDKKSYRGKRSMGDEPKALVITDMDNNKKDDIVIHVHNKIIIYYQK